ncbi:hypothetical protein YC2023_095499 [Brassica napus]
MEKYSQVWSNSHPSHVRIREDDSPYVLGSRGEDLCVVARRYKTSEDTSPKQQGDKAPTHHGEPYIVMNLRKQKRLAHKPNKQLTSTKESSKNQGHCWMHSVVTDSVITELLETILPPRYQMLSKVIRDVWYTSTVDGVVFNFVSATCAHMGWINKICSHRQELCGGLRLLGLNLSLVKLVGLCYLECILFVALFSCLSRCSYEVPNGVICVIKTVRLVAAGTGGSGSVNILRQLLFVSLTQEAASDAASERRVLRLTPIKPAVAT